MCSTRYLLNGPRPQYHAPTNAPTTSAGSCQPEPASAFLLGALRQWPLTQCFFLRAMFTSSHALVCTCKDGNEGSGKLLRSICAST